MGDKKAGVSIPTGKMVKMKFSADQFYVTAKNKEKDMTTPLYEKNKVYAIEEHMVPRWLKRGGVIVDDAPVKGPAKSEDKKPEVKAEEKEQVDAEKEKEDDGGKPVKNATKGNK